MVDVRPRQLGDVDQAVDAVEVDERAEVDDVRDRALDDEARLQALEDRWRCSLRSSSSTARRDSTTLLRERLSSMTLHSICLAQVLVEVRHAPDVDERGGQEAADPEVDDQAALDDLDDRADDRLAGLGRRLDAAPGALEAGALLGEDQPAVLVLLGEDEGVDLLAELDLVVRVDGLADRQLVGGDDALALVADVDEDLVVVDAHDVAGDDVALFEGGERRVVVGDDLAVDLEQESVGAFDDLGVGVVGRGLDCGGMNGSALAPSGEWVATLPAACPSVPPSAAPSVRRSTATPTSSICGASFAGLAVARELRGHRRPRARGRPLRDRRAPDVGLRGADASGWRNLGLSAVDPPDVRRAASSTRRARRIRWRAAVDVLDVRLPRAVRAARRPGRLRRSRPPRSRASRAARCTSCTPTAATCARRSSSTRSAGGASSARRRAIQPPEARLSRGLEVHPHGPRRRPRAVDRPAVHPRRLRLGFPAGDEVRVGVGSFDPRDHVKDPTVELAADARRRRRALPGQLDPAPLRPATERRRVLRRRQRRPLPAADRRGHPHRASTSAWRSGASCAPSSRAGRTRAEALARYAAFSAAHGWKFEAMLQVQHVDPPRHGRARSAALTALSSAPACRALGVPPLPDIAPPETRCPAPPPAVPRPAPPGEVAA